MCVILCVLVCVCVHVCVYVCMCACMCACVHACVHACVCVLFNYYNIHFVTLMLQCSNVRWRIHCCFVGSTFRYVNKQSVADVYQICDQPISHLPQSGECQVDLECNLLQPHCHINSVIIFLVLGPFFMWLLLQARYKHFSTCTLSQCYTYSISLADWLAYFSFKLCHKATTAQEMY